LAESIKMGDRLDPESQMGPLANPAQYNQVLNCIADAKRGGAVRAFAGKLHARPGGGLFVQKTIFREVDNQLQLG
jgi:aldehyde dehydrogenase (NAD+)